MYQLFLQAHILNLCLIQLNIDFSTRCGTFIYMGYNRIIMQYQTVGVTQDLSQLSNLDAEPDFFELQLERADFSVDQLQNYKRPVPLIISYDSSNTRRSSPSLIKNSIEKAARYSLVEYISLGLNTAESLEDVDDLSELVDADLIISYDYPDSTPSTEDLLDRIEMCGRIGDVVKITSRANNRIDALNLLQALESASKSGYNVSGYCTGLAGKYTRVIAVMHGSSFCYGVLDSAAEEDTSTIKLSKLLQMSEDIVNGTDNVEIIDTLKGNPFNIQNNE